MPGGHPGGGPSAFFPASRAGVIQPIDGVADAGQGGQTADSQALVAFLGSAVSAQGAQTVDGSALEQFIAAGVAAQGSQTSAATGTLTFISAAAIGQGSQTAAVAAVLDFVAPAVSGQGGQTVDAGELEEFIAAVAAAQGSQAADVAGQLAFVAGATSAQGGQSTEAFDLAAIEGVAESGQGGQSIAGTADQYTPREGGAYAPRAISVPIRRGRSIKPKKPEPIAGVALSGQGAQSAELFGRVIARIEGAARAGQARAEVIAIGTVDNRRPKNIRKAKLAALLLAA